MEETLIGPLTFDKVVPNNGLRKALDKDRATVITEIIDSGLRGRGGAGFPTGAKWKYTSEAEGDEKYVICNADEGEPGTFKDRVLLSEYADIIFDGMTIAGYAIKARKGYLYLRAEYSYLIDKLEECLSKRRDQGLLSGGFDIEIRMGAGAYICGEETALIESMEGRRGEPRDRPPFPVTSGYMNSPSIVGNVETFGWTAAIMENGAKWFTSFGTETSKGLKIYSVSGDCNKPGVFEFPMGAKLQELLDTVEASNPKAVQAGGASGQCIPSEDFSRKLCFEDISTSGSIIVFGQDRDLLQVAKNFLEFFVDESCGQCTPCREGCAKLLEGVELMISGNCPMKHLNEITRLCETMHIASKCGLGQSAPNAFLSIVKSFKSELLGRMRC